MNLLRQLVGWRHNDYDWPFALFKLSLLHQVDDGWQQECRSLSAPRLGKSQNVPAQRSSAVCCGPTQPTYLESLTKDQ